MKNKESSIFIFILILVTIFVCCTSPQGSIPSINNLFYTGFGPAENFVPETVTIEWETDSIDSIK